MISQSRFRATGTAVVDNTPVLLNWTPPNYGEPGERLYVVTEADVDRPDSISHRMIRDVNWWWLILHYNEITDPFSLEIGDRLRVPSWSWGDVIQPEQVADELTIDTPTRIGLKLTDAAYTPPAYQSPTPATTTVAVPVTTVFNLSIQIPPCDFGLAHIELQLSTAADYSSIKMSRMTAASIDRWFYYDPWSSQGAGGHMPFPSSGLNLSVYAGQPVYFRITSSDNLQTGVQYYPRFRFLVADVDTPWIGLPPIILSAD